MTPSNAGGSGAQARSAVVPVGVGPAINSVAPSIGGTPAISQVLACASGTWSRSPVLAVAWLRGRDRHRHHLRGDRGRPRP